MYLPKKEFNISHCPFCGKTRFSAAPVMIDGERYYYVMCDVHRTGCGASSGYYKTLKKHFTADSLYYKLEDEINYGNPVNSDS